MNIDHATYEQTPDAEDHARSFEVLPEPGSTLGFKIAGCVLTAVIFGAVAAAVFA